MVSAEMGNSLICSHCISNKYLKKRIKADGASGRCAECRRRRKFAVTVKVFGSWIESVIRNCLEPGEEMPFFPSDSESDWHREGEPLEDHIPRFLGQELDINALIAQAVIDAETVNVREGESRLFSEDMEYVTRFPSPDPFSFRWEGVEEELKFRRRFFNTEAKRFFDEVFTDIATIKARSPKNGRLRGVVRTFPTGTKLFRARVCANDKERGVMIARPWQEVGPPPRHLAGEGRMNSKGVVMFYGATDKATCVAELRPALKAKIALIQVATTRPLKVLDFVRLDKCHLPDLDYFQPDYQHQVDRYIFRASLGKRISQPVTPGSEHNYLVTQTMAEYLAFIHEEPFDGILYSSAQKKDGQNIVLFSKSTFWRVEEDSDFPAEYVDKTLEFQTIDSIAYKHSAAASFPNSY